MNLNDLIDELGLLVRHKLANQNIRLVRELPPDLPSVMGDAPQLEQAFLNLILNAAEAMPDGGTLTIKSRAVRLPRTSERPAQLAVEFKDTGKGMSEELQKPGLHRRFEHDESQRHRPWPGHRRPHH